jgi:hypothetical protein
VRHEEGDEAHEVEHGSEGAESGGLVGLDMNLVELVIRLVDVYEPFIDLRRALRRPGYTVR